MSEELKNKINEINNTKYLKTDELDNIHDVDELNTLFDDYDYVVVKMTASWCNPCRKIKPKMKEMIKEENFHHIKFVECDLDEAESDFYLIEKVNVIPTFILMKKKLIISIFEGADIMGLKNEIKVYMTDETEED